MKWMASEADMYQHQVVKELVCTHFSWTLDQAKPAETDFLAAQLLFDMFMIFLNPICDPFSRKESYVDFVTFEISAQWESTQNTV